LRGDISPALGANVLKFGGIIGAKRGVWCRFKLTQRHSPMSQSSHRRLRAFTLIELLVVIAIIAVLAAILVPVGQSMLRSGRSAEASSNLRQIGALYGSYVADTGRLPPYMLRNLGLPGEKYPFFQNALRMQAGLPTRGNPNKDPWLPSCFYDPVVKKGRQHLWGCFGVNPAMLTRGSQLPSVADWNARGAAVGQPPTLVSNPSKKVLACTTWGDGTRFDSSWNFSTNWVAQGGAQVGAGPDARHGGKALALFVDGHIERLDTDNMDRAERQRYFARDP
jgi:prepilin-type N-terminal cleavage/methylation domain-containing protein/prepilin-type processing-associated H-X9-DG protein